MALHLYGSRPYYDNGALVLERRAIRRRYLRTRFAIDLLSSIPYELFALVCVSTLGLPSTAVPFFRFRVVLRFYRVRIVLRRLEDSFEFQGYVAISRLLLLILLSIHWLACIYMWLGVSPDGWARISPIHASEISLCDSHRYDGCWGLYFKSLYWTISTLITVGYGDVFPTTNPEVAFVTIVTFCFHSIMAYMLGLITSYVFSLNRTAAMFRDKLNQLSAFMEYRQLSPQVRSRISELYSGRLWRSTGGLDEQAILSSLPASIRRNLSLLMYAELLLNVPLFRQAEFGFIQSLADHLRPHVYPPSEVVVLVGEIGREMWFCARGECEVLGKDGVHVFTITDGMYFGEVAALYSVKCTATVQTVTYCDLLSLTKEALSDAMQDYPKAAEIVSLKAAERMKQIGVQIQAIRDVVANEGPA